MPEMRSGAAPIVVGLDGSEASMAALRWAAEEAAAHGAPLIAVHVIDPRAHRFAPYAGRAPHAMRDPVHDSVRDADIAVMDDAAMVEQMVAESGVAHARRSVPGCSCSGRPITTACGPAPDRISPLCSE